MLNRRSFLAGTITVGIGSTLPLAASENTKNIWNPFTKVWELENKYDHCLVERICTNNKYKHDKILTLFNNPEYILIPTLGNTEYEKQAVISLIQKWLHNKNDFFNVPIISIINSWNDKGSIVAIRDIGFHNYYDLGKFKFYNVKTLPNIKMIRIYG